MVDAGQPDRQALKIANGFRFGDWEVLPRENLLRRGDQRRKLEPKVMRLLVLLAGRSDAPWTKDELMAELWPAADAGESSLTRAVSELRRALGDSRKSAHYIDTIQNVGYKAIAPLRPLDESTVAGAEGMRRRSRKADAGAESLDMAAYLIARRNARDCQGALDILGATVERHPQRAEAHAMIGLAERLVQLYCDRPVVAHQRRSREAAERALSLDPHCALAHAVLGSLERDRWRWGDARRHFERALALDADDAIVLHDYAELRWNLGEIEEADALMQRCCDLNPVGAGERLIHGWLTLHFDQERSWRLLSMARQLGCDAVFTDNLECLLLHRSGWPDAGVDRWHELDARRAEERMWMWPRPLVDHLVSKRSGDDAERYVDHRATDGRLDRGVAVFILEMSGRLDAAFAMADRALADRSLFIVDLWLAERAALREDSRFIDLMGRAGLDAAICPILEGIEAERRARNHSEAS
jgi:DNA-binding winged helix-turn-helix (wHTH) protein